MEITIKGEKVIVTDKEVQAYKALAYQLADDFFVKISTPMLREFARAMWDKAPDYFFIIPASTSGKYHAEWSTGKGGLVKHVLMGVQVAYDLSFTFGLNDLETDKALVAMFGHDLFKYGIDFDGRYHDMHPFLPRSYFGYKGSEGYIADIIGGEGSGAFTDIMDAIERHMGSLADGSWTSVSRCTGRFKPETPVEQVVHLADYISSRKDIALIDWVVKGSR